MVGAQSYVTCECGPASRPRGLLCVSEVCEWVPGARGQLCGVALYLNVSSGIQTQPTSLVLQVLLSTEPSLTSQPRLVV